MRTAALIAAVSLLGGCSFDASGSGDLASDANVVDPTLDDTRLVEPEDTDAVDTLAPDSGALDTFAADTFMPDTSMPDTSMPDTAMPDASMPDASMPDTFKPDTSMPDTFMPDTFMPDTSKPDTAMPDTAAPCSEANSGTYNGHCYFLVATGTNWTAARDACAAASTTGHPAHLAVITTVGEWSFVNGLPGGVGTGRWIGLSAATASSTKSNYRWVNSEAFAYDGWITGRPNGTGACVVMHSPGFTPPGGWDDNACTASYFYICERD